MYRIIDDPTLKMLQKALKENAFVKGHSRLCRLPELLDCDHASFFISIPLNLPQVSPFQGCQPGEMMPLLCGLHGY